MVTFLLILGGLIAFNFVLLKFSIQSVDSDKKKAKAKRVQSTTANAEINKVKTTGIPKAA
ncbi:hypothetical protein [Aquimarina sp. BL5]|uniref:hypothetical protein n=1 Tax=Aquimarina sp. BL5 TaxID=1714860 RepID=UPI000E53E913|nr:hypothetical protein [Aquimarina sp. BL5]AXT49842.1 hypothetical protein D1818_03025 [Aquimarina sp. BL5]RKM98313.1 hypothetical protein D7036_20225 [Aquimarina sp. BL5]